MTSKIFDLTGKVSFITGAGSGLGIQFAEACASAGADIICADIDLSGAEATAAEVGKLGRKALAVGCDVSNETEVTEAFEQARSTFARVDILFNNAGIADPVPAPVHQVETAHWHQVMNVDLHGVFYCAKAALKIMVAQASGKIVNVASMWGLAGSSSLFPIPAYSAAKGAVVNLTRELGLEYARQGIQVNALCPGFYRTNIAGGTSDNEEIAQAMTAFTPMGRVAEAAEIRGPAFVPGQLRLGLHDRADARRRRRMHGQITHPLRPCGEPAARPECRCAGVAVLRGDSRRPSARTEFHEELDGT
ncbi:SDR family NAD(P)-dependent oxidoreductase [Pseudonocardia xishanensis]|uniref:NAD(P)-dependent dehydrogenase (Short-subunit alcohol dehydrogenase family) n=1 Tax=Pseudonocardia xishanensis TaxID=630995 RepID=A0ABP8RXR2_9PSEU